MTIQFDELGKNTQLDEMIKYEVMRAIRERQICQKLIKGISKRADEIQNLYSELK